MGSDLWIVFISRNKKPGTVTGFFVALTVSLLAYKKAWHVAQ